jgi:hypothetical protein
LSTREEILSDLGLERFEHFPLGATLAFHAAEQIEYITRCGLRLDESTKSNGHLINQRLRFVKRKR